MRFWLEAELEESEYTQCCKCRVWVKAPNYCFAELELRQGNLPNPTELPPEPTGRYMCSGCARMTLF